MSLSAQTPARDGWILARTFFDAFVFAGPSSHSALPGFGTPASISRIGGCFVMFFRAYKARIGLAESIDGLYWKDMALPWTREGQTEFCVLYDEFEQRIQHKWKMTYNCDYTEDLDGEGKPIPAENSSRKLRTLFACVFAHLFVCSCMNVHVSFMFRVSSPVRPSECPTVWASDDRFWCLTARPLVRFSKYYFVHS